MSLNYPEITQNITGMDDFRNRGLQQDIPLVTIGMSSYNYARYIKDALDSLLTQTYPFIELIIIDDYSTDNSVEIIETWIRENNVNCTFIKHAGNKGITRTLNEMVRLSNGKYFVMFASDDIMLPERVERQVKILEDAGQEYGFCYSHPVHMDEDGNILPEEKYLPYKSIFEGDVFEAFIKRDFGFVPPTGMILKDVYEKVGCYNEEVLIEDYNFFVRLFVTSKVKYCEYPCIIYREKRAPSSIFQEWNKNKGERYLYDRIISNVNAWKMVVDKSNKKILENKISQYLKTLAANDSDFLYKSIIYLIRRGYWNIPSKCFIFKFKKKVKVANRFKNT